MFLNEEKALSEIADALSHEPAIISAIAFGSRVRGDFAQDSDFDVFILVDNKNTSLKNRIIETLYNYELKFDIPFSAIILSKDEFEYNEKLGSPFIKSIKEEGIVIYDSQQRREVFSLKAQV